MDAAQKNTCSGFPGPSQKRKPVKCVQLTIAYIPRRPGRRFIQLFFKFSHASRSTKKTARSLVAITVLSDGIIYLI